MNELREGHGQNSNGNDKKNQREAKFQKETYKGLEGRLCETQ